VGRALTSSGRTDPIDAIDAALERALGGAEGWPVPHHAVALVRDGRVAAAHGDQDRSFDLASVTKLLTAYACLVAVEEGTLDLDEPAGPPGSTVRHLLAHTSGCGFDDGVLVAPGRRRIYSNAGFELLADHLAAAAAMPAQDYVAEAVLAPLGMVATEVAGRSLAAGARSTAADLSRLAAELLQPSLVAPATLAEATTVQFPGLSGVLPGFGQQTTNDWGLGFERRDHKSPHWTGSRSSPETFGHFGAAGTFLWVDPVARCALVGLTDRAFGAWAIAAWPPLADAVLAVVLDAPPAAPAGPPDAGPGAVT
jgi:CubicO group peptidase (beta-lactamase class C family)